MLAWFGWKKKDEAVDYALQVTQAQISSLFQEVHSLRIQNQQQQAEINELRRFQQGMMRSVSSPVPGTCVEAVGAAKKGALSTHHPPAGVPTVCVERVNATIKQHLALQEALKRALGNRVAFVDVLQAPSVMVWVLFAPGGRVDVTSIEEAARNFRGTSVGVVFTPGFTQVFPPAGVFREVYCLCLDDSFENLRHDHAETQISFQNVCATLLRK